MVLFINACVRPQSRTLSLAKKVLQKISDDYETLNLLDENVKPLDYNAYSKREEKILNSDFSDAVFRFAQQFRKADEIVIAAPYWDMSFPAILKCYLESICIKGLTFRYNENGIPEGLCKAKRLIYVTTAGGYIPDNNFGYDYIKTISSVFFGIKNTVCIKAEGLDILGADTKNIIKTAENDIDIKIK